MVSTDRVNDALVSIGRTTSDGENIDVVPRFTIDSEPNRHSTCFIAVGTDLIVGLLPPALGDDSDAITHFQASVNDIFDYALGMLTVQTWSVLRSVMKLIC